MRIAVLAMMAALGAAAAQTPVQAAVMVGVTNIGQTSSTQLPDETDGILSFDMLTLAPAPVAPTASPMQVDLTQYNNFTGQALDDGFTNAQLDYDLTINISDPTQGTQGTVNVLGTGFGGFSPFDESNPFINDGLFSVVVNGVTVPLNDFFDQSHLFSLELMTGGFLNLRLFDPNPDFDRTNPTPGLALEISQTDTALYQVIPQAPTSAVPEPASATLALWMVGFSTAGLYRVRKRRKERMEERRQAAAS